MNGDGGLRATDRPRGAARAARAAQAPRGRTTTSTVSASAPGAGPRLGAGGGAAPVRGGPGAARAAPRSPPRQGARRGGRTRRRPRRAQRARQRRATAAGASPRSGGRPQRRASPAKPRPNARPRWGRGRPTRSAAVHNTQQRSAINRCQMSAFVGGGGQTKSDQNTITPQRKSPTRRLFAMHARRAHAPRRTRAAWAAAAVGDAEQRIRGAAPPAGAPPPPARRRRLARGRLGAPQALWQVAAQPEPCSGLCGRSSLLAPRPLSASGSAPAAVGGGGGGSLWHLLPSALALPPLRNIHGGDYVSRAPLNSHEFAADMASGCGGAAAEALQPPRRWLEPRRGSCCPASVWNRQLYRRPAACTRSSSTASRLQRRRGRRLSACEPACWTPPLCAAVVCRVARAPSSLQHNERFPAGSLPPPASPPRQRPPSAHRPAAQPLCQPSPLSVLALAVRVVLRRLDALVLQRRPGDELAPLEVGGVVESGVNTTSLHQKHFKAAQHTSM